jgi:hypothetical protein
MGGPSIGVDNLEKNLLSLLGFERQIVQPVRQSLDWGQLPAPAVLPPGEECWYPLNRIMCGPSIGVDNLEENLLLLLGFKRQIVQPVRQSLHRLHYPSSPNVLIKCEDGKSKNIYRVNLLYGPTSTFVANYRSNKRFTIYVLQDATHLFSLSNYPHDVRWHSCDAAIWKQL